ncbi:MAG: serine/threonine protein kinase [Ideonella sp.]|nr:serine/threonine protein kinase [Ideonella sp.]
MSSVAASPSDPAHRWALVADLFERAQSLDAAGRERLLADPDLAPGVEAEVRSLLVHAARHGDDFLAEPAALPPALLGQRLGAWRVVSHLGAGGMGEVWLAERADGAYQGRAAIKVLKRGMDSEAVLARFAREQQLLARLSHPNIARLIDAGRTPDGLPYFVMEHVAGRTIDRACDGLPVQTRVGLFLQLADAVAHAHRHLLVHRDLKPGNVLVTGEGQVKLLDFGIAKALTGDQDESGADLTQLGARPFTPHYASPEQVRGEPLTTATDVYSLGVLLYVMLTGQRPYGRAATSPSDAARAVLDDEPLRPGLGGDLDNVVLKALEKVAERRYPSVDALAADLRAWRAGYPVSARAPSAWYLLRKFVTRNRGAAALAGLAAASLVGGLAATTWQMQRADRARESAERRFAEVRQLANQLVFRYHDQIRNLPGAVGVRQALLDDAARYLDELAGESGADPNLARELAETYHRLSLLQGEIFSPSQERVLAALANAHKATALAAIYVQREDAALGALNTAVDMWLNRATIEARLARLPASVESLRQAAELADAARRRAPDDKEVISRLATLEGRIALALGAHVGQASLGRIDEARAHWDRAVALFDELVRREPDNHEWVHQLAWGWIGLVNWSLLAGRFDDAVEAGRRAVELRDRAAAMQPGDAHLTHQRAAARNNLASALALIGEHAQALRLQDEALAIVEQSLASDPQNKAAQRDRALIGLSRARPLAGLGQREEALAEVHATLVALPASAILPDDFYMARWRAEALIWLARLQRDSAPQEAAAAAREAIGQMQGLAGENHAARRWATAQAWTELAQAQRSAGARAAAAVSAREALQLWGEGVPGYFAAQQRIATELSHCEEDCGVSR